MHEDGSERGYSFPPTAADLDAKDRRGRRLYLIETPLGAALLVVGVLGGLGGDRLMWFVAACGAGIVGIGVWGLLRYRRIAADVRYVNAATASDDHESNAN